MNEKLKPDLEEEVHGAERKEAPLLTDIISKGKELAGGEEEYERAKKEELPFLELLRQRKDIREGQKLYGKMVRVIFVERDDLISKGFVTTKTTAERCLEEFGGMTPEEIRQRLSYFEEPETLLTEAERLLKAMEKGAEEAGEEKTRVELARNIKHGKHALLGFGLRALKTGDYDPAIRAFAISGFLRKGPIRRRLAEAVEENPLEVTMALEKYAAGEEVKGSGETLASEI